MYLEYLHGVRPVTKKDQNEFKTNETKCEKYVGIKERGFFLSFGEHILRKRNLQDKAILKDK